MSIRSFIRIVQQNFRTFTIPFIVISGIILSIITHYGFHQVTLAEYILLIIIIIGSFDLIKDTAVALLQRQFALDYIALVAITVGVVSHEYLVASVIVLMLTGGNTLEVYGMKRAKQSLTALTDRIPTDVHRWVDGHIDKRVPLSDINIGELVAVRKGEVVPLDGVLFSKTGLTDESSLTGEPYVIEKSAGDQIRSGTINIGEVIVITVTKIDKDSTYRKIIEMVQQAQSEKAPLIRLADRYSTIFTLITFGISLMAYFLSNDLNRVLAVLVIATPCPLILATPIALMGGMNAAAKKRIIMKKISTLEVLARVDTIIFDKTGTLTLGKPTVTSVTLHDTKFDKDALAIAAALERNSLHPLAKAIVEAAKDQHSSHLNAQDIHEEIGKGISGFVDKQKYTISKAEKAHTMTVVLRTEKKTIATIEFEDTLKTGSSAIVRKLQKKGLAIMMYTGDKLEAAQKAVQSLGTTISIKANCTPKDKRDGIAQLKHSGHVTAMVGDGINDAPALALADVGMVFSNEEQTAASEAADVVFLGGSFSSVTDVIELSKHTIHIALQSILIGIALSTIGMLLASFGFVPPIVGAFMQEAIDIFVIFNALRTSRAS